MADATQINEASRELVAMTKLLSATINHKGGKFSDSEVVSLMVSWFTVIANMRGTGDLRTLKAAMVLRRAPDKQDARFTRAGEFFADLNIYKGKISDGGNSDNEYIQAQKSALNFLYDYRGHYPANSKQEKAFELVLTAKLNDAVKTLTP